MQFLLKKFIFKTLFSPGLLFGIVLMVVLMFTMPAAFAVSENTPVNPSSPSYFVLQTIGTIGMSGLSIAIIAGWGITFSNIKNSNIIKRLNVSKYEKKQLVLISLIPLSIIILIMIALFYITLFLITTVLGSLTVPDIANGVGTVPFDWSQIDWLSMSTAWALNIVLTVGFVFFSLSLFKSRTGYMSFSWLYVILGLLFGGSTMPISVLKGEEAFAAFAYIAYAVPQSYINFFAADSMNNQLAEFDWSTLDVLVNTSVMAGMSVFTYSFGLNGIKNWE